MIYEIEIVEKLSKKINVTAENEIEAIQIAQDLWQDEKIVLGADDFEDVEFWGRKL